MKNACLVVKMNNNGFFQAETTEILDCFIKNGYPFDEIRLTAFDEKGLLKTLRDAEQDVENLLLLCDGDLIPLIEAVVSQLDGRFVRASSDAGMLVKESFSLFLVSHDNISRAQEFIKSVCLPEFVRKYQTRLDKIVVKTIGASKERVEEVLLRAKRISGTNLAYNHRRNYDEDIIEVFYDSNTPRMLTDDVLRVFAEELQDYIYALEDKTIEEQLVELLKLRNKRLSVAESFTGGGVARRIVSVPGASEVYFEGLNTYNEFSKIKRLGVREYTLKSYGAVSDSTVYEMAAGLIATGDADISIATTGLAGPKSDKSELPVGLSYIAVGTKEKVYVFRFRFEGNRKEITEKAINHALFLAYRELKNM
ncbi:MAG: CinA family protein [Clostridiales bacterium]|nr:CinA family protein [Clostridiales bacterium]